MLPAQQPAQPAKSGVSAEARKPAKPVQKKPDQPPAEAKPKPDSAHGLDLDIVLACPIESGNGNAACAGVTKAAIAIPQYNGAGIAACSSMQRFFRADSSQVLANIAEFLAANLALPTGYTLAADGNVLLISSSKPSDSATARLGDEISAYLALLNSRNGLLPPLTVEQDGLRGSDTAHALDAVAGTAFQVTRLTATSVLVSGKDGTAPPSCQQWDQFFHREKEILRAAGEQESPVYRTYEIHAADAAKVLSAAPAAPMTEAADDSAEKSDSSSSGKSDAAATTKSKTPDEAASLPLGHPGDDLLIFSPGSEDDPLIPEKQRILAALDLPRPQMIINGYVFQSSAKDPAHAFNFRTQVTHFVDMQNDALQAAILTGWQVVRERIRAAEAPGAAPFFDAGFKNYLMQRKAFNDGAATAQDPRDGFCGAERYCLGYTGLFHPEPRLTDLLLAFVAAARPADEIAHAVDCVEYPGCNAAAATPAAEDALTKELARTFPAPDNIANLTCDERDLALANRYMNETSQPRLFLECFREKSIGLIGNPGGAIGTVRAALADFLFNYKVSQLYPHEFVAYDLTHSAVEFDMALEPIIDAFNRDIAAYQVYWQKRITVETRKDIDAKNLVYGGVLTVRTVGGNQTSAGTKSQSFLNVSEAPQVGTLLSALVQNAPEAASPLTGVLANLSPNQAQALSSALQGFQTTQAQIGRSLSVTVQPRSLAGASEAEMDVTFNASESVPPSYFGSQPANSSAGPDLSRVSAHSVTTHVRVDSLKLFEVSSMTAVLRGGRTKFPLIPPFVELPYIGSLVGIPLPQSANYQTSTAVLSAVVVPTASDLASGLRFRSDLVIDGPEVGSACSLSFDSARTGPAAPTACPVRRAESMDEVGGRARLIEFNREMVACFASGAQDCAARTSLSTVLAPGR